jgi:hypothetical protein
MQRPACVTAQSLDSNWRDDDEESAIEKSGLVRLGPYCRVDIPRIGISMAVDLSIPDDLSIPEFLKRKPDAKANTGTGTNSENVIAAASDGACHAPVAERTVPIEGTGTVPPSSSLRDTPDDAVSKAARRISRKHQRREELALGKIRRK